MKTWMMFFLFFLWVHLAVIMVSSSLISENKIRLELERKLGDYKWLVNEINFLLENKSNDVEQVGIFIEKFFKIINEKQKQLGESLSKTKFLFSFSK